MHELTLPLANGDGKIDWNAVQLGEQFRQCHERAYGFADASMPCEVVNLRLEGIGLMQKPQAENAASIAQSGFAPTTKRRVYLGPELGSHEACIYQRERLREGQKLAGPAVINQPDTTIFVLPGQEAEVGLHGVLRVKATCQGN